MKKSLSAIFLAIIMLFATACGNSDSQSVSPPAKTSQVSSSDSQSSKPAQNSSASSSSTTAKNSDKLPDVPKDHWARKSVLYVVEKEILPTYVDETPDGRFLGDRAVTSYEFAMGLAKILDDTYKGTIPSGSSNPFPDIPKNHWAYDSVRKLEAVGVVEGYGDGTFRGDREAIRYETALYAAHLLSAVAPNAAKSIKRSTPFPDIPKDHWAYNSISLLTGASLDEGYADRTFRGDRPRTRYEAAQLLAKLHIFLKKANG